MFKLNGVQIKDNHKIAIDEECNFLRQVQHLVKDPNFGPDFLKAHGITSHGNKPKERVNEYTTRTWEEVTDDDFNYRWQLVEEVEDAEAKAEYERVTRIAEIEVRLSELDVYMPRGLEDICKNDAPIAAKLSEYNVSRMEEKAALRVELAELQPSE